MQVQRFGSISLHTKEDVPAAIDHFDAGAIDTDFFLEETHYSNRSKAQPSRTSIKRVESDDEYVGNPIVASDEDLDEMEYYGTEGDVTTKRAPSDYEEQEEEPYIAEPLKYKSSLLHVWGDPSAVPIVTSQGIVSQHNAEFGGSDSEDEDNRYDGAEAGHAGSGTAGEYEEIGGSDNPWSFEHPKPFDFGNSSSTLQVNFTGQVHYSLLSVFDLIYFEHRNGRSLTTSQLLRFHLR